MKGKMTDKKKGIGIQIVFASVILLMGLVWTGFSAYLLHADVVSLCRNLLFSFIMSFLIVVSFLIASQKKNLYVWNEKRYIRFAIVVVISFVFMTIMGEIPYLIAPVSLLGVILTLFSGNICGLVSYSVIVLHYAILNGLSVSQLIVLLMAGILGSLLFMNINHGFRYVGSLFAYLVADFVLYSMFFVMTQTGTILGDAILYSAIRLFAAGLVVLIVLKVIGKFYYYKDIEFYSMINDPEYELLTRLKQVNKDAYFHAVHTAYLADRIAKRIRCNAPLAKAGGYYHKIGLLQGNDSIQNTILVGASHDFPQALIRVLKEYGIKNMPNVSKEAAIVQLCDAMVSSVSYLFKKDNNAVLNYEKIINVIIRKKLDSDDLEHCELTMEDLYEIKKSLLEEKLYYDFLR